MSRLFFALWPPEQVRQSIAEASSRLPRMKRCRDVKHGNLHITLHFIGSVTEETRNCMHTAAASVDTASFELKLDHFGRFPRAKVLWMGCRDIPVEVRQLYEKLGVALKACGYQAEQRAFAPHITLKRKCIKPDIPGFDFSIPWTVNEFVLVESITHPQGVEYRIIDTYPLM